MKCYFHNYLILLLFPPEEAFRAARVSGFLWVKDARCPQTLVALKGLSAQTIFPSHLVPSDGSTHSLFVVVFGRSVCFGSSRLPSSRKLYTHWSIWGWVGRMMWLLAASKIWHQWKYEPNVFCMLGCEVFIALLRAESMNKADSLGSWFWLCLLIAGWHLWT